MRPGESPEERRAKGTNGANQGIGRNDETKNETAGRDNYGRHPGLTNDEPNAEGASTRRSILRSIVRMTGKEEFWMFQPPDAENRTSGGVGGSVGEIPLTRPDPECGSWKAGCKPTARFMGA